MSLLLRTNRYRLATEVLFHQYPLQHPMPALWKDDTPTEESLIFSTLFLRRRTYRFRLFWAFIYLIKDHFWQAVLFAACMSLLLTIAIAIVTIRNIEFTKDK